MALLIARIDAYSALVRVGRPVRRRVRIVLQLRDHLLDGRIKLRVSALRHQRRIVHHLDVRVDPVAFDGPCTVLLIERERWRGDTRAVDQRWPAGDADQPAPGARAYRVCRACARGSTREMHRLRSPLRH